MKSSASMRLAMCLVGILALVLAPSPSPPSLPLFGLNVFTGRAPQTCGAFVFVSAYEHAGLGHSEEYEDVMSPYYVKDQLMLSSNDESRVQAIWGNAAEATATKSEDWEHAIHDAKEAIPWGKEGQLLLLPGASHHFKRSVTIDKAAPIPFNETIGWPDNKDHWFNIDLANKTVSEAAGVDIPGKLFTTRMPQGLDRQAARAVVDSPQKMQALGFLVNKKAKESKPNIPVEAKVAGGEWRAAEVVSQKGEPGDAGLGEWQGGAVSGTVQELVLRFKDDGSELSTTPTVQDGCVAWSGELELRTTLLPTDTDREQFIAKVKEHRIQKVIVLPEHLEHYQAGSSELLTFYEEECKLEVFHTPIVDFTTPSVEHEKKNIEELAISLRNGQSCLVHCWGGSGRTGTVICGAVKNFGVDKPIAFIRKVKSVYLETDAQEQFVTNMTTVLTERMMAEAPTLTIGVVFDQLRDLCRVVVDVGSASSVSSAYFVDENAKYSPGEIELMTKLFNIIDVYDDDQLEVREFLDFFNKHLDGSDPAITEDAIKTGFSVLQYCSYEQPSNVENDNVSRYISEPDPLQVCEQTDTIGLKLFLRLLNSTVHAASA